MTAPTREELATARGAAVDANLTAEHAESSARRLRRIATAKQKHYEDLLLEANGQLTFPETDHYGTEEVS